MEGSHCHQTNGANLQNLLGYDQIWVRPLGTSRNPLIQIYQKTVEFCNLVVTAIAPVSKKLSVNEF